jgi:hypothetical protein
MWKKLGFGLIGLVLSATIAGARDNDQWLHVSVDGLDEDSERVRINVPLSLVSAILPLIEDDDFHRGRIVLDGEEFDRADLVAILDALREAEDGEYVTVQDRRDFVRVAKEGGYLLIHVEERHPRTDEVENRVDVRVPLAVIDALTSGEENELDLAAAVEALGEHGNQGDLVTVNDDENTVRIWIDRENTSD